jgi:hypothetical protein
VTALTTPARWVDGTWQSDVTRWAREALDGTGRTLGQWTQPHIRPWSTVLRLNTERDPFWLKANGDGTRHEPKVLALLAGFNVPFTPRPVAIDADRGWSLLPDGGPTAREAHGGLLPLDATLSLLSSYAALQRATEAHVDAFVSAGVDDVRPHRMASLFEDLVDRLAAVAPPRGVAADVAVRLRALMPAYADACAELAASPVRAALQHDDLHSDNVFEHGTVVFDWGDCVVGHPFGTLLVSLNSVAHHHGLERDAPELTRLADAYTESWTDVCDRDDLRRQVLLAIRVGPITRVLAWLRALDGVDDASRAEWDENPAGWLGEIAADDLPLHPPALR